MYNFICALEPWGKKALTEMWWTQSKGSYVHRDYYYFKKHVLWYIPNFHLNYVSLDNKRKNIYLCMNACMHAHGDHAIMPVGYLLSYIAMNISDTPK